MTNKKSSKIKYDIILTLLSTTVQIKPMYNVKYKEGLFLK